MVSIVYVLDIFKRVDLLDIVFMKNTDTLLEMTLKNKLNDNKNVSEEDDDEDNIDNTDNDPIIYFYNTHQTEGYKGTNYGITPSVVTVSQMLRDNLKDKGKSSFVETLSIKKGLNKNNYGYEMSYEISLGYLKQRLRENKSLKYFFDIHRDSVRGDLSRCVIDGKKYAKVMFLIGESHNNYKANLRNAKKMESFLNKNYSGILRDTYHQPRWAYNQEFSEEMFLIEVGGPDNTLEEIYNTSVALSEAIDYYTGG